MALKNYVPRESGDENAPKKEHVNPRDIVNTPVVLFVREIKMLKTKFAPNGKEAVIVDVASPNGKVVLDNAWLNDALVDQLRGEIGQLVATKVTNKQAASGFNYFSLTPLTEDELAAASSFVESKGGNPFNASADEQAASPAPKAVTEVGDDVDSDAPGSPSLAWGVA